MLVVLVASHVQLCNPTDWSLPASSVLGFFRQEYWSGLPFLSPEDLPDRGIKPRSPALQADSLPSELQGSPHSQKRIFLKIAIPVHHSH